MSGGPLDDLDLCLLAWREAPRMLERFHDGLAAALPSGWAGTVVLMENAAPPATSAAARAGVRRSCPDARRLVVRSPRNLGYAQAMDLALAECRGRYVALLNSDGRPEPGMLEALVAALDADPDALWAAPAVHGPGERDEPPGPAFAEERLAGMALVVRRDEFVSLGAFDPLFVFYNEDHEASDRARSAGHRLLRVPDARFHHGKGGRSRRGTALREWWYAWTAQTLEHVQAVDHVEGTRALARRRTRSLRQHVADRDVPGTLGIGAATLAWPVSVAAAEHRRRHPWTAARLAAWLERVRERHGLRVEPL